MRWIGTVPAGDTVSVTTSIQSFREFAASVDGSLLNATTWRQRHRWILLFTSGLTLFCAGYTLFDVEHPLKQWLYVGGALAFAAVAGVPRLSHRVCEVSVTVALLFTEFYITTFVGNVPVGALTVILITFYQDWLPVALACLYLLVLVVLAFADPSLFEATKGLAAQTPQAGMSLRAVSFLLAAALALAIWRAGTQLGRDHLTGMLSRAGAEHAINREIRRGHRPAVWVCDVDNFQSLNNYLGSELGDRLLKYLAGRFSRLARSQDGSWFCARAGADTFLIVARHAPDDEFVTAFAHRLEEESGVATTGFELEELSVRFSVGAAAVVAGEDGAGLVRAAERNMLRAKGRGLLRVVVEDASGRVLEQVRPLLSTELDRACENDELEFYLQPIVRLGDGAPVGAEALVRWNHPERGLVFPGEFLPEAERDSGLMAGVSIHLGKRYLRIAGDLVGRHGNDWLPYGFSYNLAAIRLRDPTLAEKISGDLADAGLAGAGLLLNLEVTEGALMDIEHGVPKVLAAMRGYGYRIALDDFGKGHSSLAHLRDFPLDSVKIDKSFVQSMDRSPIDRAVVQAVADIASATGLTVVAEGVETEGQREMLLGIKPDILAQGWLYAKAMPVADFEAWALARKPAVV
jgi:diguanylate cyclase